MENIKFIKRITQDVNKTAYVEKNILGNCIYFTLKNGNRAKAYCGDCGAYVEIINATNGPIDKIYLPFSNYFDPVKCSAGAPEWTQSIKSNGMWRFEEEYTHVLPKDDDYRRLAKAIETYLKIFG